MSCIYILIFRGDTSNKKKPVSGAYMSSELLQVFILFGLSVGRKSSKYGSTTLINPLI